MNTEQKTVHQRALEIASRYRKCEGELLEIIIAVDKQKVFRALGYSSLFQYAVCELKFSEAPLTNL